MTCGYASGMTDFIEFLLLAAALGFALVNAECDRDTGGYAVPSAFMCSPGYQFNTAARPAE